MSIAACEDCDFNQDLYMCMTCGHLACSADSHSLEHFKDKKDHALAIQMNSINSFGKANIFCYECNKNVKDLKLKKHLKTLGLNIS
jgi:ubiquitin carboxyl-terminal hydrolase 5/13